MAAEVVPSIAHEHAQPASTGTAGRVLPVAGLLFTSAGLLAEFLCVLALVRSDRLWWTWFDSSFGRALGQAVIGLALVGLGMACAIVELARRGRSRLALVDLVVGLLAGVTGCVLSGVLFFLVVP